MAETYNVTFSFTDLDEAKKFLAEMRYQGYDGVIVNADTMEAVEDDGS